MDFKKLLFLFLVSIPLHGQEQKYPQLCMCSTYDPEVLTDHGHAYLTLQQSNTDKIQSFGFWPDQIKHDDYSKYKNKKQLCYCEKISAKEIEFFFSSLREINHREQKFSSINYNCTNFVHEVWTETTKESIGSKDYRTFYLIHTPEALYYSIQKMLRK